MTRWWTSGVLVVLVAAMAVLRLIQLDLPFHADYMTQRLMFGSLEIPDILAHRYHDSRHPQGFYLLLHVWEWGGIGEGWMRGPAVLCSLAAAPLLALLARPALGWPGALGAAALLGLSAPLLAQSRDVSDLPLFLALAIASSHLLLHGLRRPSPWWAAGYAVAALAMTYTYYLAGAVLLAHAAALAAAYRTRNARWLAAGLAAATLLAIPVWLDLWHVIQDDRVIREAARQYPDHLWGEQDVPTYLAAAATVLVPGVGPLLAVPVLALVGLFRWGAAGVHRPALVLVGVWAACGLALVLFGVSQVRLAPHYLLFALPPLLVAVAAGALGPEGELDEQLRRAQLARAIRPVGLLVLAAVAALYAVDLARAWPELQDRASRDHYRAVGAAIADGGGPDRVVGDPDMLQTILLYYAFPDPTGAYRTCRYREADAALRCETPDGELVLLTPSGDLRDGWQERSLARFRVLHDEPLWYVETDRFANPALGEHVREACSEHLRAEPLTLFRCDAD